MTLEKKKFDYKWVILILATMMVFVCLGFCSSNKGLYLSAITEALGVKRSLFSINDSCRFIAQAVINLFFGSLIYRYGIKKMVAFGFFSLILAMLIYAFSDKIYLFLYDLLPVSITATLGLTADIKHSIYIFYLGGIMLGIGLTFTTTTMASSIVRRWFKKDIGKYTGIVFASNGVGGAVAAQIVTPMINDPNNAFGYRNAYLLVCALLVIIGVLILIFLKERPKDDSAEPVPVKKKARGAIWSGIDYKTAIRSPFFYLAGLCVFFTGFSLQGIGGVYAAHMKDVGLTPEFVATVSSVYSLCLTVSKLAVGAMYDRFGLRTVMLVCQSAAVIAFICLAMLTVSLVSGFATAAIVVAFVFAVLYALALPLETLVIPLIANELFGSKSFDKLLGLLSAMNYAGYALGGPIVNLSFDAWGTYKPVLLAMSGITVIMLFVFQLVINIASKKRKAILAAEEAAKVNS